VGAWTMVLCEAVQDDGTKGPLVTGNNPAGQYIFTENGYFSFQAAADLPKFASNSRMKTTPEENKAVVEGLIAYYGTYTVNDADSGHLPMSHRSARCRRRPKSQRFRPVSEPTRAPRP